MREPGLPPSATATARTSASQRPTLRPYRRPTGGVNGSLNVRRGQGVCVQRNRRTDNRSLTLLPLIGRSDSVRSYRLWSDVEGIAQSGQFAPTATNRPDISTMPSITVRLSTIKPGSRRLLSHAFEAIHVRSLLAPVGVRRPKRRNVKSARNVSQTPFCTPIDIRDAEQRNALPAGLLDALIWTESRYNPMALSKAGAAGLGQLMPGTASAMGVANRYDPRANILGAARNLRVMLDEFGAINLAVAAYNAGPGAVRAAGGIPSNDETPSYVRSVLNFWRKFAE